MSKSLIIDKECFKYRREFGVLTGSIVTFVNSLKLKSFSKRHYDIPEGSSTAGSGTNGLSESE